MVNPRSLTKWSLLLFVLASAIVMVTKEVRRSRAVSAVQETRNHAPHTPVEAVASTSGARVEPSAPAQAAPPEETASTSRTVPRERPVVQRVPSRSASAPAEPPERSMVRVAYFHTTSRCVSCYKIENYTRAAMEGEFARPLEDGRMEWRTYNVDEPANRHFIEDYGLFTKSVIVSEMRGGREVRWENLDQVWSLLGDEQLFKRYIVDEIRAFSEGS